MSVSLSEELGYLARRELAVLLDRESPQGRDWMGLADRMGFTYSTLLALKGERSPTLALLDEWERAVVKGDTLALLDEQERAVGPEASIATLMKLLDSLHCGEAVSILKREKAKFSERRIIESSRLIATEAKSSSSSLNGVNLDPLRRADGGNHPNHNSAVIRETSQGSSKGPSRGREESEGGGDIETRLQHVRSQKYDVFLSFAEEDKEFAEEMRRRLITHAKLRVFVPSDGLMAGKVFHREIADMIKQGCRKTVVILSPDYISSPWCNYEANLALVASPDAGRHILIPVLYRQCEIPPFLSALYYSDYPRHQGNRDECERYFWQKLYKSLNYTPPSQKTSKPLAR